MSEIMSSPESNSNENQNCNKKRKSNDQSTKEAQKNIPKVSKSVKSLSPIKFLKTTKRVKVTLKWNLFYVGDLCEFDKYFNLVLINADEWVDNKFTGRIDQICIRCNNVKIIEEI